MAFPIRRIVTALLVLCLFPACDGNDDQAAFWAEALSPPSGFTETSADGTIVSEDPDDWRTSPYYRGLATVEPPYPNPNSGQTVLLTLHHTISQGGPARIGIHVVEDDRIRLVTEQVNTAQPGAYQISFNPSAMLGEPDLYRFLILDDRDELISYGDIMVQ